MIFKPCEQVWNIVTWKRRVHFPAGFASLGSVRYNRVFLPSFYARVTTVKNRWRDICETVRLCPTSLYVLQ